MFKEIFYKDGQRILSTGKLQMNTVVRNTETKQKWHVMSTRMPKTATKNMKASF